MLKVDLSGAKSFFDAAGPDYAAAAAAHRTLTEGTGLGADFTGWLGLPQRVKNEELKQIVSAANRIRGRSEVLVVIGIGGSYLGAKGAIELLRPRPQAGDPKIIFAGNSMSPDALQGLLRLGDEVVEEDRIVEETNAFRHEEHDLQVPQHDEHEPAEGDARMHVAQDLVSLPQLHVDEAVQEDILDVFPGCYRVHQGQEEPFPVFPGKLEQDDQETDSAVRQDENHPDREGNHKGVWRWNFRNQQGMYAWSDYDFHMAFQGSAESKGGSEISVQRRTQEPRLLQGDSMGLAEQGHERVQ